MVESAIGYASEVRERVCIGGIIQVLDNRTLEFISFYVTSSISLHHTTTPNTTPMMIFHT